MERYGLLGAKRIASAAASASSTPGAGVALLGALVVDGVDLVSVAAPDEPLLEREPARLASRRACGADRPSPGRIRRREPGAARRGAP